MSTERPALHGSRLGWVEWLVIAAFVTGTVVMLYPTFPCGGRPGRTAHVRCAVRMQMLVTTTRQYARDNEGRLPTADQGLVALYPDYVDSRSALMCPARMSDPQPHYALSPWVAGRSLADLGDGSKVVLLYEVNARGMPVFPHEDMGNYAFLNGDVECLAEPPDGFGPVLPEARSDHE